MMFSYHCDPIVEEIQLGERRIDNVVVGEDIAYESPKGGRVTATLLRPGSATGAPPAGLLMMHWGFGDRLSFLSEAMLYARAGALVLLIDAPGVGGRGRRLPRIDRAHVARTFLIQCVTDLRRGVDLLLQRGVGQARIGYVGHSLGAAVGVPFVGVEERLAAAVLMTPLGDLSRGGWVLAPDQRYREAMAPLDGTKVIGDARADLYFQFAERDPWVDRVAAGRLCAAARQARVGRYDADHRLSPAALSDRAAWLCQRLALTSPRAEELVNVRLPNGDLWRHWMTVPIYRLAKRLAGAPAV